ncbi:hypothetical protein Godav_029007 [Gossypium davidsonii]|uniref:Uncharacterized protein n=1 Tax=Gossypium davidsonii TaxID=34287 RepID=A0A7J8TDC1_GOSDV|nr:hypothetical protein [Gossypium davidsonii]
MSFKEELLTNLTTMSSISMVLKSIGIDHIIVETDYLQVIFGLNDSVKDISYFGMLISDHKALASQGCYQIYWESFPDNFVMIKHCDDVHKIKLRDNDDKKDSELG